ARLGRVSIRPGPSALGRLELDLNENELEAVGIDDVVLDADLAGIRHTGPERRRHRRLAVKNVQFAGGHRDHDIVVIVAVPAGVAAGGKTPFGDDDAVVLDLDGGLRKGTLIVTLIVIHGRKPNGTRGICQVTDGPALLNVYMHMN